MRKNPAVIAEKIIKLVIIVSCAFLIGFAGYHTFRYRKLPQEGVWYCEELGIQWNAEGSDGCYLKEGDSYIYFAGLQMPPNSSGSSIKFICQDREAEQFSLGEPVFSGVCIKKNKRSFTLRGESDGKKYVFNRVENDEVIPETIYYWVDSNLYTVKEFNGAIETIFNQELSLARQGLSQTDAFCATELQANSSIRYKLYCAHKNCDHDSDYRRYNQEAYLYAVITQIDGKPIDGENEAHIYSFCVTSEEMQPAFYGQTHTTEEASSFLPEEKEYIGTYTLEIS